MQVIEIWFSSPLSQSVSNQYIDKKWNFSEHEILSLKFQELYFRIFTMLNQHLSFVKKNMRNVKIHLTILEVFGNLQKKKEMPSPQISRPFFEIKKILVFKSLEFDVLKFSNKKSIMFKNSLEKKENYDSSRVSLCFIFIVICMATMSISSFFS